MLFQLKATPAEYKRRGSITRSKEAGWCCTRAVLLYGSPKPALISSRDDATAAVTFNG